MNTSTLFTVMAVHIAAVMAPGANFLVVVRHSLDHSRQTGVYTAVGVASGSLLYITMGLMGISAVLVHSPWLVGFIRVVGGLFLLYMSYRVLAASRTGPKVYAAQETAALNNRQAFFTGFFTSISNPNSALYFLAMFTTTLSANLPASFRLFVAVMMGSISLSWYVLLAMSFSNTAVRQFYGRVERWSHIILGILLFLLGVRLILMV